jgi:hypothetical protein
MFYEESNIRHPAHCDWTIKGVIPLPGLNGLLNLPSYHCSIARNLRNCQW